MYKNAPCKPVKATFLERNLQLTRKPSRGWTAGSSRSVAYGHFVGEAVDGSEAPDEVARVDADDAAVGEDLSEDTQGDAVQGVVECGDEHGAVGDVEVRVARGQALPVKNHGRGHGQGDDVQAPAVFESSGLEALVIFGQRAVIGVARVRLLAQDHRIFRHEAA